MKGVCFALLLLYYCFISCKQQSDKNFNKNKKQEYFFERNFTKIELKKTKLSEELNNIDSFLQLFKNVDSLNTVPYSKINSIGISINKNITEIESSLTEKYKYKNILSRLNLIHTYSQKLVFKTSLKKRDTTLINVNIKKIIINYNNLITQIKEIQFKFPEDFKKELEQGKSIKKDTVEVKPLF